ncbi:disulfide bond formation protein DsbD [Vibrio navarrensis]|nr:disulfide bond formation protein DsbD [Vibrio navarrensis]
MQLSCLSLVVMRCQPLRRALCSRCQTLRSTEFYVFWCSKHRVLFHNASFRTEDIWIKSKLPMRLLHFF